MLKLALRGLILSLLFIEFISIAQAGRVLEEGDESDAAVSVTPAAPAIIAGTALRRSLTAPIPIQSSSKNKMLAPLPVETPLGLVSTPTGTPPLFATTSSSPRISDGFYGNLRPASASPGPVTSSPRKFPFGEESNGFLPHDELAGLIERREWPGTVSAQPVFGRTSTSSTSSTSTAYCTTERQLRSVWITRFATLR